MAVRDEIIKTLRILLGDDDPNKYIFQLPLPSRGGSSPNYMVLRFENKRDYLWTDDQLWTALILAAEDYNSVYPRTTQTVEQLWREPGSKRYLLDFARIRAWEINAQIWIVNGVEVNVGGVSINLAEKFDRYNTLLSEARTIITEQCKEYKRRALVGYISKEFTPLDMF